MNSLNSIHNFKKKISVVASATIPFWEPTADTDISYATYSSSPSSNINAGTGLTGSNQAVVYDYNVVATPRWVVPRTEEFYEIGDLWTIILKQNISWHPSIWQIGTESNHYSQSSTSPCILVSYYGQRWTGLVYNEQDTSLWLNSLDGINNYCLVYDNNAPTDSLNNVYNWYSLIINDADGSSGSLINVFDSFISGATFSTRRSIQSPDTDTNVTLRTLPFGTYAPANGNTSSDQRISTDFNPMTDILSNTYDRNELQENGGTQPRITLHSTDMFPDDIEDNEESLPNMNYHDYEIKVVRYTNESLPQILKTRLFS